MSAEDCGAAARRAANTQSVLILGTAFPSLQTPDRFASTVRRIEHVPKTPGQALSKSCKNFVIRAFIFHARLTRAGHARTEMRARQCDDWLAPEPHAAQYG